MKVFKFICGEIIYAFAAQTKELAITEFNDQTGINLPLAKKFQKVNGIKKL